jgi:hypothetical protein
MSSQLHSMLLRDAVRCLPRQHKCTRVYVRYANLQYGSKWHPPVQNMRCGWLAGRKRVQCETIPPDGHVLFIPLTTERATNVIRFQCRRPAILIQPGFSRFSQSFFPVPVCAITASGVPGGTLVSMNRFSTLCGWLAQRQVWRVKGWIWPSKQPRSAKANSWLDYQMGDRKW